MKEDKIVKEIVELFKSGKFTIVTHDRGEYTIYKKHYEDYDKLPSKGNYLVVDGNMGDKGYFPAIVCYLVEALGGKTESV